MLLLVYITVHKVITLSFIGDSGDVRDGLSHLLEIHDNFNTKINIIIIFGTCSYGQM